MPKIVFYVVAAMLIVAALPLPYGFYTFIRISTFLVFIWLAFLAYTSKATLLIWAFIAVALLFNPLIPIYLPRGLWIALDILTAIFVIWSSRRFSY